MQSNSLVAALASALLLTGAVFAATWFTDPLRIVLALPVVFFWPGYLALRALGTSLPPIENALAAAVISIAICVLGCFVLYGFSALTPAGWALWTLFVIGALSFRIVVHGSTERLTIKWPDVRRWHIATMILAGVVACSAYAIAIYDEQTIPPEFSYTEFWILSTKPGKLVVGIRNKEFETKTYDVSVTNHEGPVAELHSINVNPGETWTHVVNSNYRTEATLYLHTDHGRVVYRRVTAAGAEQEKE